MKERMFKTMSGKDVALRIFVQENNLSKVGGVINLQQYIIYICHAH